MLSDYRRIVISAVSGLFLTLLIIIMASEPSNAYSALYSSKSVDIDSAKNGLVAIQTGFDDEGTFHLVKQYTGFIVSNKQGSTYIVTSNHAVTLSSKERKKAKVSKNAQKSIHIIVRGDVYTQAESNAVLKSKEQDFCILSASDVIKLKDPITFKGAELPEVEEPVYSLGFPSGEDNMLYESEDAVLATGKTKKTETIDGKDYISHTIEYDKSCDGGILTDENGYVIGMLNRSIGGEGVYALPAGEIIKVLDNAGISCNVKPAVSKGLKLAIVLGLVIIILFIRLIKLLIWRKKHYNGRPAAIKGNKTTGTDNKEILEANASSVKPNRVDRTMRPRAVLIQTKINRQVTLVKPELTIGQKAELVDFAVEGNKRVSREHARIFWDRASGYIIEDLGSSNGTFVDGKRVPATGTLLRSGDLIRLADEEFEFRIVRSL